MKTYKFRINGNEYNVEINSVEGNLADVTVNGAAYKVEMENAPATPAAPAATANPAAQARQDAPAAAPAKPAPAPAGAGKAITSPLPGVIIEVSVKEGQAVKAGQKVAVIEAMKMENEIQASSDGTVTAVLVNKGDSVLEGTEIVKIA
ncbi:MAG: biotin/lipoyl-binding protein [Bacteroidales bacterium]|jgi:biotin carboxyl carrier protein|nr:biotin/lipoyl-binding protein [Bacteroidales bacterium]MBQ2531277.1 biotin/lipoyl-binding protein [Bacteroidales bacterium]MBQ5410240.1 biotin/lipoyl-binding protein [Bacteroidales bacterium]MBQ6301673.1 biotin/lipoyl-binding protein [Bacteroidales bacterium]